jgi:uncharacterized membrane protein YkoI
MNAAGILAAALFAGAMGGCAAHEKEDMTLSDTPAAVQATARSVVGGNKVGDIDKTDEDGKVAYEIEYNVGAVEHAVVIAESGDVLEQSVDVEASAVPAAVTDAMTKAHPDAKLGEAELTTESGRNYYELEVMAGGDNRNMQINPDGSVISDKIAKPEAGEDAEKKD